MKNFYELKKQAIDLRSRESKKSKKQEKNVKKVIEATLAYLDTKVISTSKSLEYVIDISYSYDTCVTFDGKRTDKLDYIKEYIYFDSVIFDEVIKFFNELDGYKAAYLTKKDGYTGDIPTVRVKMQRN